MTSILLHLNRFAAPAAAALLMGAALAHAQDQTPGGSKLRQLTPHAVEQKDNVQTNADKNRADIDRKFREMDRRMNRTLRSVCVGC